MTNTPRKLQTAAQLSRRIGIPAQCLIAEAKRGTLPHTRAGNAYIFDGEIVERLLLERARELPATTTPKCPKPESKR